LYWVFSLALFLVTNFRKKMLLQGGNMFFKFRFDWSFVKVAYKKGGVVIGTFVKYIWLACLLYEGYDKLKARVCR